MIRWMRFDRLFLSHSKWHKQRRTPMASQKVTQLTSPVLQPPVVYLNALPHSVEIARTAKGDVTFSVKVYGDTSAAASHDAQVTFDALQLRYPLGPSAGK
jgi:hypothetical protein